MAEEEMAAWSAGANAAAPSETVARREAPAGAAGDDAGMRALVAELLAAVRDAGTAMLEAHKELAAEQTAGVADAVQRFGRSVDQTQSRVVNRYCDRAAASIAAMSAAMRARSWGEIAAEAEDFARRRPAWFILAALGTGFAAGRLLLAAADSGRRQTRVPEPVPAAPQPGAGQTAAPRIEGVR